MIYYKIWYIDDILQNLVVLSLSMKFFLFYMDSVSLKSFLYQVQWYFTSQIK